MKNIVWIGNNLQVDTLMAKLLRRNGYMVQIATTQNSVTFHPDLIILDCDLTPYEGFQKYDGWIQSWLPAKILWISSNEDDEIKALEFGADEFIKKPYHVEVLLARIGKLCTR